MPWFNILIYMIFIVNKEHLILNSTRLYFWNYIWLIKYNTQNKNLKLYLEYKNATKNVFVCENCISCIMVIMLSHLECGRSWVQARLYIFLDRQIIGWWEAILLFKCLEFNRFDLLSWYNRERSYKTWSYTGREWSSRCLWIFSRTGY
jgi:hypothetical protein